MSRNKASKRARAVDDETTMAPLPFHLTCPICYEMLFKTRSCEQGHSFCLFCFEKMSPTSLLRCPICRECTSWNKNLALEDQLATAFPLAYEQASIRNLDSASLQAYILKNVDPQFRLFAGSMTDRMALDAGVLRNLLGVAKGTLALDSWSQNLDLQPYPGMRYSMFCIVATHLLVTGPKPLAITPKIESFLKTFAYFQGAVYFLSGQLYIVGSRFESLAPSPENEDEDDEAH